MRSLPVIVFLALAPACAAAVTIDGQLAPGEWDEALHVSDFRQTQPLTGAPANLPTEAWVLATPEGLAIAFRLGQPPEVPRTRQRLQRDFEEQVDRVNVMVDFNGDGRSGYDFTLSSTNAIYDAVLTGESRFDRDWDGVVQHAVGEETDGWTAELLIPWHTAPMHKGRAGKRSIGLYLDRVVGATGERMAWPFASFERPRFLSEFERIEIDDYAQSLLALTPHVSGLRDLVGGRGEVDGGVDLFWKPSGQFQLTASLKPDFGQVESDDLVVNFSATETWYSDKRPFFTENQGLFNFELGGENGSLVYTRRVGGPADDGRGAAELDAAVKLNGSLGTTGYGLLAAREGEEAGRSFAAARVVHDFGTQSAGALLTHVDRPWLGRRADVLGIDHQWRAGPALTVRSSLVGSEVGEQGRAARGFGASVRVDHAPNDRWHQQWALMHFDDRFEVNDFGYLARNDYNYLGWQVERRQTELPESSRYRSHGWELGLVAMDSDREHLRLRRQLRLGRSSTLRSGGWEEIGLSIEGPAWDDQLTRGHGALRMPAMAALEAWGSSPRQGDWSREWSLWLGGGGLLGNRRLGYELGWRPRYFVDDALSLYLGPRYTHSPDWLVWQEERRVGRFRRRQWQLDVGLDWHIDARQELRIKMQLIGLDAQARGAILVDAGGHAVPDPGELADFSLGTLALQVRYRYELAPLSNFYVVYGRGGFALDETSRSPVALLGDALGLRDDEQILLKLSYRFEL